MNEHAKTPLLVWVFQTGEPLHTDGGSVRPMRAMNLSNALVAAGHQVVLWSSAFYHQEKRHRSTTAQRVDISDRLQIRLIPSCGYRRNIGLGRLIDHAQLAHYLKKMLRQPELLPDVAFIGYPPIETAAVLTSWLAKRGIPSLLDVKDQWPSIFLDTVPLFLKPMGQVVLWPYFHMARTAMREATGLSSMASRFLDWAQQFTHRERTDRNGVFPLTSPLGQVSPLELEQAKCWWDEQKVMNDGRFRICFIGSLSTVFDFQPIKKAAEIAVQEGLSCEFIICGDGGSAHEIKTMMTGLSVVRFPGWIDCPKIEALAERCQMAIAPYFNKDAFIKSIPNKIIDALSLGLPILCPLQGEVARLIDEHGVGLRYGTDTSKSLHDCIQTLMRDKALRENMSQRAKTLYLDRFSFEKVYGGLVKHLEKMAQSKCCQ